MLDEPTEVDERVSQNVITALHILNSHSLWQADCILEEEDGEAKNCCLFVAALQAFHIILRIKVF